ncbi:MAG TPA: S41 family peptidase [Candidatus Cloacimonetes bacterium]|nr:S41 family peptidase [Candidatus Cloacimonadota bacterium]
MKKKQVVLFVIVVALIFGYLIGRVGFAKAETTKGNLYDYMKLFTDIITKLNQVYVEPVDAEEVFVNAIEGMLDSLDPYTTLLTPEEFADLQTSTKGEFGGLGIHISSENTDYIQVISVIEATPAFKANLLAGDEIIAVDGTSTKDWTSTKAVEHLRGQKGSEVIITIQREGLEEPFDVVIVRDKVKMDSVPYAYKIGNIGYIRITNFNSSTGKDLHDAMVELERQGIEGLLIDVRSNPGGLLSTAIETVDQFLPKNKLVVETKGRVATFNRKFYSKDDYVFKNIPIIVLINQASASAAEIFAGSLQDWDKALIVGQNSFGKGSVQQLFPLPMNYGLKITTSKYYIESGRCIHNDANEDAIKENDITKFNKNVENHDEKDVFYTVGGREVYGGGGITPDITIKQDTLNTLEMDVRRNNLFFPFAVDFLAQVDIDENFYVDDELFAEFVETIREKEIEFTNEELADSETWLRNSLESQIISNKFGLQEGNKRAIRLDPQLQAALKLFDEYGSLEEMFAHADRIANE